MTVALIDDDEAVLDSLGMLLRKRGLAVECFASARAFLSRSAEAPVRCIVSDVRMPGLTGLDLQFELSKRGSSVPLILITGHGDIAMAVRAVKMGAFDFIEKPFNDQQLLESIRSAVDSDERSRAYRADLAVIRKRVAELSQRQRQVMDLVAKGLSNKEIAEKLVISMKTVSNHITNIFSKLQVADRAQAIIRARDAGLG